METAPQVMAGHLLSKVEPLNGTMDVLADEGARQQLDRLVDYLVDPEPSEPFVTVGMSTQTNTSTDTGPSNTNTIPDADSDTESRWDDE
ncbi:hypothetical protein [Saccharothrix coeruleofusca]|uniref:Uncharacterized protein n=1 Tax=Saccharothrix coeruleofusca TaxID=33919 RepID=A0A918EEQ1_9PSEU|nr:hypothetical protein [Saccharothrix coeruleofusca]MBP2334899.1 hypothetical protein [Saccharothrix coeruleofusca]GGP67799.1 hypothetical protein GCM10010185_45660 [Saccharothrix coeruleofusca]